MKFIYIILLIIPSLTMASEVGWPSLDSFKYVEGRHANEDDIANGAAIFVAKTDAGYIGKPINILIPQYAIYTDSETGNQVGVVIIQAESAQGMDIYGAINLQDGSGIVSVATDFQLLGKEP